ncbi:methyltransferase domain-containing protein [Pseudonocardia nematodicida]|uniref:Calmodulin-lysine N-methyltransferase n=1 Tax=Pseudonocardia nematodicida TaxID=1206997 RepID=A0ABV1KH58_9PSEU
MPRPREPGPTGPGIVETVPLPRGPLPLLRPADPDDLPFDTVPIPAAGPAGAEELHPPHWAHLWPAGRALAVAVDETHLAGRRVVELGCGLGLPSLVAARADATAVLATDRSPAAVAWVEANARRLGAAVDTATVAFDEPVALRDGRWDLVLASDVLYGAAAAGALLELLPRITADDGEVWLTDPGRPEVPAWLDRARERWTVRTRPLPDGVALHVLHRRS